MAEPVDTEADGHEPDTEATPPSDGAGAAPPAVAPSKPSLNDKIETSLRAAVAYIVENYCTMDPRTAGVFRIVYGFLCGAHAVRHWQEAQWAYSNDGVLTNHLQLFRPSSGFNFSIFHAFSSLDEVHVAFALCIVIHALLMIGWHTRFAAIASFVIVTSLDNRLVLVENGGYVVVNLVAFYAMFLPLQRRFSVDALVQSYRERHERTLADLNDHPLPAWATTPRVSLAVLLVILNLAVVYLFNVVNKSGAIWRRGETVHYVLWLNRMVTGVAVLLRTWMPFWLSRILTYGVLVLESLLFGWIVWPKPGHRYTRPLAIAGIIFLHTGLGVMMRLGPFSWFLIGWSMLLVSRVQWDDLEAWMRARAGARMVAIDGRSPFAFALARFFTRLDGLELLRFEQSTAPNPDLFVVRDLATGTSFEGAAALREIVRTLPVGRLAWPLVRPFTPLYLALAARRAGVARFFGLGAPPRASVASPPSPLGRAFGRGVVFARESWLAWFFVCAFLQTIHENKAIPPQLKPEHLPQPVEATIVYPRLFQGWGMFAPNPIVDDGSVTVDAMTIDGRRVDPFTGEAPDLDITDSDGLGLTQIRQDYFNRIRLDRNRPLRQGLSEYLQRWHKLTGRPEDELVAFDVYWVRALCPKPHEPKKPTQNETVAILTWRKPGYRPPKGLPPLPREPAVLSAESPKKTFK